MLGLRHELGPGLVLRVQLLPQRDHEGGLDPDEGWRRGPPGVPVLAPPDVVHELGEGVEDPLGLAVGAPQT